MIAAVAIAAAAEDSLSRGERAYVSERVRVDCPDKVTVDAIDFEARTVVVRGHAGNPNAIANFVENMKFERRFTRPDLRYIRVSAKDKTRYDFEFLFVVKRDLVQS